MSEKSIINIMPLFSSPDRFPWDFMGWTRPNIGQTHSYLCTYLAEYGKGAKSFMLGHPCWFEVVRYVKAINQGASWTEQPASIIVDIKNYCNKLYELRKSEREAVAAEVLDFLKDCMPLRQDMEKNLTTAYIYKRIVLPTDCLIKSGLEIDLCLEEIII